MILPHPEHRSSMFLSFLSLLNTPYLSRIFFQIFEHFVWWAMVPHTASEFQGSLFQYFLLSNADSYFLFAFSFFSLSYCSVYSIITSNSTSIYPPLSLSYTFGDKDPWSDSCSHWWFSITYIDFLKIWFGSSSFSMKSDCMIDPLLSRILWRPS